MDIHDNPDSDPNATHANANPDWDEYERGYHNGYRDGYTNASADYLTHTDTHRAEADDVFPALQVQPSCSCLSERAVVARTYPWKHGTGRDSRS
jgi:hypothetical protein